MDPSPPVRILLVDDRPTNLLALESALASSEYELVKASSGAEALGFLLKSDCALILMDVNMPEMDGYETARLIRKNKRTRSIPIVFITAHGADERQVLAGYETGAIDYLFKPVAPDLLRSKVAAFAALHRAQQQLLQQAEVLREHERLEHAHALAQLELKSLKRQEAVQRRYRNLVDGITHAVVWVLDPETFVCQFASPSAERILGYPLDRWSADATFWLDRLPPEDRGAFLAKAATLSPGTSATLEHRLVRFDGRLAWVETAMRLLPGDDGERTELHGFSVDVTEAVAGREALAFLARASADLSESLDCRGTVEKAAAAVVPALADFSVVEVVLRPGEEPIVAVGYRRPELEPLARRFAATSAIGRAGPQERAQVLEPVAGHVLDPARDVGPTELSSIMLVPLSARDGVVGAMRLFTTAGRRHTTRDREVAEELGRRVSQAVENAVLYGKARDAVQLREQFLSIASHELRTPLSTLRLQARAIENLVAGASSVSEAPPGDLQRRVRSASRQVDRLVTLVNSLFDLAKMRSGRMTLELGSCDLREIACDVVGRFEEILARQGRALDVTPGERITGRWDRSRLDQLVTNLVANAVKHGGAGPVTVSVTRAAGAAVLAVTDSGPGIAEAELRRIFDPFEQGERGASRGGLGLGLYIARNVVEAHGGRISVASAPGRGATFRVELPLAAEEAPDAARGPGPADARDAPAATSRG